MKKALLGIILAAALLCCFAAPALAADTGAVTTAADEPVVTQTTDVLAQIFPTVIVTPTTVAVEETIVPVAEETVTTISTPSNYTGDIFVDLGIVPIGTIAVDPAVQPKMGDNSVDTTVVALIGAIAAAGMFVGLKKRAQA